MFLLISDLKKNSPGLFARISSAVLSAALIGTVFAGLGGLSFASTDVQAAVTTDYGLASTSQEGVILHCWNWSYKNIKKYMKDIAAAGYTSVQTSPVQQPKDYYWEGVAYGNVGIPNGTGGEDGNWWKAYQPVTFSICDNGYTWYGTKQEFKEMCAEADKYGVRVIVDIVANHMGNIKGYIIGDKSKTLAENQKTVLSDISPQVGQFWKKDMLTDPSYWHISTSWTHSSDGRFDVTQGNMGMPDLNTGDSKVQQMVLGLLKECIDCGADGFRFDAAKHIETPKDSSAFASDFWDVVLDGAREYYKKVNGYDGVYFYGEVLNRLDDTNAENYYLSKMSITDNSTSDNLRNSVMNGSVEALANSGYCGYIHGKGNRAVLWPESHDTYMGGGSSYDANDRVIKQTWSIIASRKDSTGLFFSRPYYSKDILAGDVSKARQSTAAIMENIDEQTQLGDVGTLTWADPAVVAVNRFRNFFVGQSEKLGSSGHTAYNMRGKTGIVIVRGEGPGSVSLSVGMQDGTYYDQVSGEKFTVSGGVVKGTVKNADGIAVVYNPTKDYGAVNPVKPTVIRISAETDSGSTVFKTDTTSVRMIVSGSTNVKYTTSEGVSGSFSGGPKTITVGNYTATGSAVTLTVTATASDGLSKTKTYQFTKKVDSSEYPTLSKGGVVFDNSTYKWTKVYCYAYDESGSSVINNAAWPGVAMAQENGDYWSYEYPDKFSGDIRIIFNNGSGTQYPSGQGLLTKKTDKKLFKGTTLTDLPASQATLSVKLSSSVQNPGVGQSVTLTAKASNVKGTAKYTFMVNDGTTLASASTSNTCTWTPSKSGTYIIAVKTTDSSFSITDTIKLTVGESAALVSTASVSSTKFEQGKAVTLYGSATGGKAPYQYAYYYKKSSADTWTRIKAYSSDTSASVKPASPSNYNVMIKVKDSAGTVAAKTFTLIPKPATQFENTSTISATSITLGNTVTVNASATGGTAPYQYAVYYKKSSNSTWSKVRDYSSTAKISVKPSAAVPYDILVKVKDNKGNIAKKIFVVKVQGGFTNTSKLSATSIKLGSTVTVTASSTGGNGSIVYGVYYKKASKDTWTTVQSYGSNKSVSIKPGAAVTYDICVKAKDSTGKIEKKYFTLKVSK